MDAFGAVSLKPRSMNRFLYAEGNPWSMVDPSGHGSYYEGEGCGPGGIYCGSTGTQQKAKTNAAKVAKTGNPHHHDSPNGPGPQGTPAGTPTAGTEVTGTCTGSACAPPSGSGGTDGPGTAGGDHGTPPSQNDMWNAYVSCATGASHMSSMIMCMEGQLHSSYWAVVAFGRNYDGKFDGLPAWATAVEIVAAIEAGRVGYLGAVADMAAGELSAKDAQILIENGTRVGSGTKEDLYHLVPQGEIPEIGAKATVTTLVGGDNVSRFLVQMPVDGGRVEWIVDMDGNITHETFIDGGTINGIPNKP